MVHTNSSLTRRKIDGDITQYAQHKTIFKDGQAFCGLVALE